LIQNIIYVMQLQYKELLKKH